MQRTCQLIPATLLLAASLAAPTSEAASRTVFEPSVEVDTGYTDNVRFTADDPEGDVVSRLIGRLPLLRETRRSSLQFEYRPSLFRYQTFSSLDRYEHFLQLQMSQELSRKSDYRLRVRAVRTQRQADATSSDDSELVFSRRTNRQLYRLDFGFDSAISRRWSWGIDADASGYFYDDIDDFDDGANPNDNVEDRIQYGARVAFLREMTALDKLGGEIGRAQFDLEISGEESLDLASVVYQRALDRGLTLSVRLGAFYSTGTAVANETNERAGAQGSFEISKRMRELLIWFAARHQPSAGGALQGSSTNTTISMNLKNLQARNWMWQVSPRLAQRVPTDPEAEVRTTIALNSSVERRIMNRFWIKFGFNYAAQERDESADRSQFVAGLGLVYYPKTNNVTLRR